MRSCFLSMVLVLLVVLVVLVGCGSVGQIQDDANTNNSPPVCGNGAVELGELCDEGAQNSDTAPNACRTTCRTAYCGDGTIDASELCDDANTDVGDGCAACQVEPGWDCEDTPCIEICGDGMAVGDEPCDASDLRGETCISLGQATGELRCNVLCTFDISGCVGTGPICGNGEVEQGEDCDDGNSDTTDDCPDGPEGTCLVARCGDGFVWAGHEECDDGNGQNGDLCPDGVDGTCSLATCGDGHVWLGEEVCDTGSDPYCYAGCLAGCGDGRIQEEYGEFCDDGPGVDNQHCYAGCTGYCGDGIVDPTKGEECDPGAYMRFGDSCNPDCTTSGCGDGWCNFNTEDQGSCPQDCGSCGDGICEYGIESSTSCPQDCDCPYSSQFECNGACYSHTSGYEQFVPVCCANGPVSYDVFSGINCGACGINCGANEICNFGHCYVQD